MIRVFIGFDNREIAAFHVLSHSIHKRATQPVSITPLMLSQLGAVLQRSRHPLQTTDFAFSRFLTPYLSNYEGWSIYMDCDMLMLDDISRLWRLRDEKYAVMLVKHSYTSQEQTKFLGNIQTHYERKNWSSLILFNNKKCWALTPDYVNSASGLELHQFKWLESEACMGDLPTRWNHLVGINEPNNDVSLVHFTLGGPYFKEYSDCEYSREWRTDFKQMLSYE